MMSASSIPPSCTLRVLSQNVNGFQTKVTLRKRKQARIVALGSLPRSLEVDFFTIQVPHFVAAEDLQAGTRCLSKCATVWTVETMPLATPAPHIHVKGVMPRGSAMRLQHP